MNTPTRPAAVRIAYQFDPATLPIGLVRCHIDYATETLAAHLGVSTSVVAVKPSASGLGAEADHRVTVYVAASRSDELLTLKAARIVLPHLRVVREQAARLAKGQSLWTPGACHKADDDALLAIARQYVDTTPEQRAWLEERAVGYELTDPDSVEQWPSWELAGALVGQRAAVEEEQSVERYLARKAATIAAEQAKAARAVKRAAGPQVKAPAASKAAQPPAPPRQYFYARVRFDIAGRPSTASLQPEQYLRLSRALGGPREAAKACRAAALAWTPGLDGTKTRSAFVQLQMQRLLEQHA